MAEDLERRAKAARQMERVRNTIREIGSGLSVCFDSNPTPGTLRFYVETSGGVRIIETSGDLGVDEVSGWDDARLRDALSALSGGRI